MTFVVDIYDPQRMNNVGAPLMFPLVTPAGGHFQKYSQNPHLTVTMLKFLEGDEPFRFDQLHGLSSSATLRIKVTFYLFCACVYK